MTFPKNFIVGQRPTTSFPPAWVTCHGQLPMHTMTKQTNSSLFSFLDLRLSLNDPAVTDSVRIKFEKNHVFQYHFTARFCTSPFLSSSNFKSICTTFEGKREQYYRNYCPSLSALKKKVQKIALLTFLSLSSSNLMESFWSSAIRSFVAINLKSLSLDVICQGRLESNLNNFVTLILSDTQC